MSLINDPGFLTHRLRLSYLRTVDDPYGSRLITLNPSYNSNPYIVAASLADVERWPELTMPSSPQLSDDEGQHPSAGANLKYTQTIMGSKSGGVGLRVSGRRSSASALKRASGTPRQDDVKGPVVPASTLVAPENWAKGIEPEKTEVAQPQSNGHSQADALAAEAPVKAVQYIPRFKGAAEMEARRRMRMLARRGPAAYIPPIPQVNPALNPELSSSSSSDEPMLDEDEDEFEVVVGGNVSDDDEFDPDFAATRIPGINSDSASDVLSYPNSVLSSSNLSAPASSVHANNHLRSRSRLSPVTEGRIIDERSNNSTSQKTEKNAFPRHKIPAAPPIKSALTAMLASAGTTTNPFAEMYAAISGRAETASMNVLVYFPRTRQPAGKAMDLSVRKDATMEEVIGFALWNYWEEGWLPKLDEGLSGEDDPKWAIKLSALGWIMRIAEDDGEVDDEFPPPDRTGKISKFNFDAYAVLEASPSQVQQNQILESKIQRRPSRSAAKKAERPIPGGLILPPITGSGTSAVLGSTLGSLPLSTSLGPSSSHGPQIFLRIRVADSADAVHISTTIPVSAGMYMQEALELVCRKRKLMNPKDYALLLEDMSILIPLDRTVASLQGKRELILIKTSMLPQLGIDMAKGTVRTTDPNASIFKRMSDVPETQSSALDYTAAYKKFTIYRKMPMLVARQERTLAIDGVYVHIMPSTNKAKAVFDSGKTYSYHIKSVSAQQSTKSSSVFKLVVSRDARSKRYDFEAESPKLANEIVQIIKSLKAAVERSGPGGKARRSRHVV